MRVEAFKKHKQLGHDCTNILQNTVTFIIKPINHITLYRQHTQAAMLHVPSTTPAAQRVYSGKRVLYMYMPNFLNTVCLGT